jgi:hypothetical protein
LTNHVSSFARASTQRRLQIPNAPVLITVDPSLFAVALSAVAADSRHHQCCIIVKDEAELLSNKYFAAHARFPRCTCSVSAPSSMRSSRSLIRNWNATRRAFPTNQYTPFLELADERSAHAHATADSRSGRQPQLPMAVESPVFL